MTVQPDNCIRSSVCSVEQTQAPDVLIGECGDYQAVLSGHAEDPAWDNFLAQVPGGHHVQTSLWAQVKAVLGWRATRLIVSDGTNIVAGAQILMRPFLVFGSIGYVPKGPLIPDASPELTSFVLDTLVRVIRMRRIRYLAVQPPNTANVSSPQFDQFGFRPSTLELAPTVTTRIDLTNDLDVILANMRKKTRSSVRMSQRRGITVREADEADLPTFHRLLLATSARQGFNEYPLEYFEEFWQRFAPAGYIKLFLAEFDGEPVSGLLAIPFGDTVIYKKGAWSGQHSHKRPNEAIQWAALNWAKAQGYRYYDFEGLDGLDPNLARQIAGRGDLPTDITQTVAHFKLGFGGKVVSFPQAYDYIGQPVLRWIHVAVMPKVMSWPATQRTLSRLRTR